MSFKKALFRSVAIFLVVFGPGISSSYAQGSIFGTIRNSGGTTPSKTALSFYGFIDNSDVELRIDACTGADYEGTSGNWYDDFQNYLSEAPGMPYQYNFYNSDNNEGYILSDLIPDNSFQEESFLLNSVSWPNTPSNVTADINTDSKLVLHWDAISGQNYHIYRRESSSNGSFYRIDDPGIDYTDPGVSGDTYIDTTGVYGQTYSYVIIPAEGSLMGPRTAIYTFSVVQFLCGDVNNDEYVNLLDILDLIAYKYRDEPAPANLAAGDVNGDGTVNLLDILDLIEYKYRDGPEPTCGQ